MSLNLTPINAPRIAPVPGARTLSAVDARARAMASFNESITTTASPSQADVSIDPTKREQPPLLSDNNVLSSHVSPGVDESKALSTPFLEDEQQVEAITPDPKEAKIAAHYANFARKEKALRFREAQLRQRESSLTPQAAQTPAQIDTSQYVKREDLVSNPFGVLNDLGLSYEQLTQKALEAPSQEDMALRRQVAALEGKLKALESGTDAIKKNFEENQTQSRTQAELQIKQDVNRLVANDPRFEVVKATRSGGEVVKLITSVFDNGMGTDYPKGTVLDLEEATQMIEDELMTRHLRTAQLKKIQARLNETLAKPQTAQKQQTTQQQPQLRTLTNGVGQSSRQLSPRDRALAAFRGENVG